MKLSDLNSTRLGFAAWVSGFVSVYMIFIGAQLVALSLILAIDLSRFALLWCLFLAPATVGGSLLYLSKRGGVLRLKLFICAAVIHFVIFALVIEYSAYRLGYLSAAKAREFPICDHYGFAHSVYPLSHA